MGMRDKGWAKRPQSPIPLPPGVLLGRPGRAPALYRFFAGQVLIPSSV